VLGYVVGYAVGKNERANPYFKCIARFCVPHDKLA
jgi:hypothetical protein